MEELRLVFYDFDGTLIESPMPNEGKKQWEEVKGEEYPHVGWWSKPESLDLEVFDIQTIPSIVSKYHSDYGASDTKVILMTNRLKKISDAVKKVLEHHGLYFDEYSFASGRESKGSRVLKFLEEYPATTRIKVEFYDDDIVNLQSVKAALMHKDVELELHHVPSRSAKIEALAKRILNADQKKFAPLSKNLRQAMNKYSSDPCDNTFDNLCTQFFIELETDESFIKESSDFYKHVWTDLEGMRFFGNKEAYELQAHLVALKRKWWEDAKREKLNGRMDHKIR